MSTSTWSHDPFKLASMHRALDGTVVVSDLLRASKLLASEQGALEYHISFDTDVDKVCVISGEMHGILTLCCQRCLQSYTYNVTCEFAVSPVHDESAAKQLPSSYEPVLLVDGKVDILELLEDELILTLPQVPMHAPSECAANIEQSEAQEMNQPFQILQQLKLKSNLKKNRPIAED